MNILLYIIVDAFQERKDRHLSILKKKKSTPLDQGKNYKICENLMGPMNGCHGYFQKKKKKRLKAKFAFDFKQFSFLFLTTYRGSHFKIIHLNVFLAGPDLGSCLLCSSLY